MSLSLGIINKEKQLTSQLTFTFLSVLVAVVVAAVMVTPDFYKANMNIYIHSSSHHESLPLHSIFDSYCNTRQIQPYYVLFLPIDLIQDIWTY